MVSHEFSSLNRKAGATALSPALGSSESPSFSKGMTSSGLYVISIHSPVVAHTLSVQFASAFSTAAFYPFDVVKTRFMSQDGTATRRHNGITYRSMRESFASMHRAEGLRSLFKGLPVTLVGAVTAWGTYMYMYRSLCNWAESTSFLGRSALSFFASSISSLFTSPIFLIKSRMQLEETLSHSSSLSGVSGGTTVLEDPRVYRTFRSGFKHILKTDGVSGLWKGLSLQLMLIFPYFMAYPTYDFFKSILLRYHLHYSLVLSSPEERSMESESAPFPFSLLSRVYTSHRVASTPVDPHDYSLNLLEIACCSGLTKVVLQIFSHPLIVLRVRIQDQRSMEGAIHYRRVFQSMRTIIRHQGFFGMYRGFAVSLAHILPRGVMQYTLYELMLKYLTST